MAASALVGAGGRLVWDCTCRYFCRAPSAVSRKRAVNVTIVSIYLMRTSWHPCVKHIPDTCMNATLALEDGSWYRGVAAGASGETSGEVVFNTSMTGYQEVLTDPSYAGQIVTMTAPQIGNYGVAPGDAESQNPHVAGFIMREASPLASNYRADGTLRDYLTRHGIVAIADIDTRALTRVLRSAGVMRGVIATGQVDPAELVEKARAIPKMEGADLVKDVTCERAVLVARSSPAGRRRGSPGVRCRAWSPGVATLESRCLRLRHQVQHPAAAGRLRMRRPRLPRIIARRGPARDRTRRDFSQQRAGRSGCVVVRGRATCVS